MPRRAPACLELCGERRDQRVGEAERSAGLLGCLRRERLDPAEQQTLAIVGGEGQRVGAASAARASASMSIISARRFSSAVPASKLLFCGSLDTLIWVLRCCFIVAPVRRQNRRGVTNERVELERE